MINNNKAKYYCREDISLIKNYEQAIADETQTWECHHILELTLDGEFAHTKEELKRLGMYYHRPANELIFLTRSEHMKLHLPYRNTEEFKRKMSKAQKGKKHKPFTEETKLKISKARKGVKRGPYKKQYK